MQAQVKPTSTALEIAGERRLRQLLCALDLLAFAAIGLIALYLWRYWPNGRDVYSDLQQGASLTYMAIWAGIALLGALAALSRRTRAISVAMSILLLMEFLAQLYFHSANNRFYHPWARAILERFEPHPLLVGIPHTITFGGLSHDAMHRRTTINEGKAADAKPIYVFGGSTAYDVGNIDADTWASDLSRLMGPHYEVQNYGVPAYSSLGAMIQSLFVFRDVKPVCAVYYFGWNDLLLSHLNHLSNDYATYEAPRMLGTLAVGYRPGTLANYWLTFQLASRALQSGPGYPFLADGTKSDQKDMRLSRIFSDNVKLIVDIDRHFGVKAVFVPQIVNYEFIDASSGGWWPFIPTKAVRPLMHEMHLDMQHAAEESGAMFLAAPLAVDWQNSDFVDEGHFAKSGSAKFAAALAPDLLKYCQ